MSNFPAVRQDVPVYRIIGEQGFFGPDCHLYRENDIIYFDGVPNEEMEPLNQLAVERLRAYIEQVEAGAKEVAAKAGRSYAGRPRNVDEALAQARADVRQVQLTPGGPGVPLMGGAKTDAQIGKVEIAETPDTTRAKPGRQRRTGDLTAAA